MHTPVLVSAINADQTHVSVSVSFVHDIRSYVDKTFPRVWEVAQGQTGRKSLIRFVDLRNEGIVVEAIPCMQRASLTRKEILGCVLEFFFIYRLDIFSYLNSRF